jgi:hypothetical protein
MGLPSFNFLLNSQKMKSQLIQERISLIHRAKSVIKECELLLAESDLSENDRIELFAHMSNCKIVLENSKVQLAILTSSNKAFVRIPKFKEVIILN